MSASQVSGRGQVLVLWHGGLAAQVMGEKQSEQKEDERGAQDEHPVVDAGCGDAAQKHEGDYTRQDAEEGADGVVAMADGGEAAAVVDGVEGQVEQAHDQDGHQSVLHQLRFPFLQQTLFALFDEVPSEPAADDKGEVGAGVLTYDGEKDAQPGAEDQPGGDGQQCGREEDDGTEGIEQDIYQPRLDQAKLSKPYLKEPGTSASATAECCQVRKDSTSSSIQRAARAALIRVDGRMGDMVARLLERDRKGAGPRRTEAAG